MTAMPAGIQLARFHPADFARWVFPDYRAPAHIMQIGDALRALAAGTIKRLAISMPPRHGKSWLASRAFPLWYLGTDPTRNVILTSYGADLATDHSRWIRNAIPDAQRIFPGLTMADDCKAADAWQTSAGGSVFAAGVGGPITGRGADLAIIDDPIKNWEDAQSIGTKRKIYEWYQSTLLTRLSPAGRVLLIQTRWALDDLAGRILDAETGWTVLRLPAIADEGTDHEAALWADQYPLDKLRDIRDRVGARIWSTVYQQQPTELSAEALGDPVRGPVCIEGPEAWTVRDVFGYVDPAGKGEDSTAVVFGGALPDGRIGIVAAGCWRQRSIDLADVISGMAREVGCQALVVEDNYDRGYTRDALQQRGVHTRPHTATKNKVGRIGQYVKARYRDIVHGPRCSPDYLSSLAGWWELAKHDDAADALAGLVETLDAGRQVAALDYEDFPYFG